MGSIRVCREEERAAILAVVNAAAEAYRGVIPPDRWREAVHAGAELDREMAAGVTFWGYETDGALVGVMGIQRVGDVELIRHAYVSPSGRAWRRRCAAEPPRGLVEAAHPGWHLGRGRVGDPLLSPPRVRAGPARARC